MNPTGQLRAVLILDVWNPYLTAEERIVLTRSMEIADEVGLNAGAVD